MSGIAICSSFVALSSEFSLTIPQVTLISQFLVLRLVPFISNATLLANGSASENGAISGDATPRARAGEEKLQSDDQAESVAGAQYRGKTRYISPEP
jgi:hypothetical protein